ncbi:MAG: hypothetical protein E7598_06970 [Ruminococcaceae bacterium]|nr:hypothetical protein [Oscillospiraceae bacterium]
MKLKQLAVITILLSMLLSLCVPLSAANANIVINGVDIGYGNGDYFTKNGQSCRNSYWYNGRCHKNDVCVATTHSKCNCMRYWPTGNPSTCQVDLLSSQCMAFARYCQWRAYGTFYTSSNTSKFTDLTGRIKNCTAADLKAKLRGCAPGTHVRTSDAGYHSVVIVFATDWGVNLADANYDGYCNIRVRDLSWAEFATYMNSKGGILYSASYSAATTTPPVVTTPTVSNDYHECDNCVSVTKGGYVDVYSVLNVRTGPSTNYEKAYTLPNETSVEIKTECNGWYEIKTAGGDGGWVAGNYITITYPEPNKVDDRYPVPFKCKTLNGYMDNLYDDVNGNRVKGAYIAEADECIIHTVFTNGWVKVEYPGAKGQVVRYAHLEEFLDPSYVPTITTATVKSNVYTGSDMSKYYGYIDSGDTVVKVGSSGAYTLAIYPITNGYKLGWTLLSEEANSSSSGVVLFNGHTYHLYNNAKTWEEAKLACERLGGHLVTITSKEEQEFIASLIDSFGSQKQYWLGASDSAREGTWKWVTGEKWSYTNWDRGMPDNNGGTEHYLQIYNYSNPGVKGSQRLKWNDITVDNYRVTQPDFFRTQYIGFICEWEPSQGSSGDASQNSSVTIEVRDSVTSKLIPNAQIYLDVANDSQAGDFYTLDSGKKTFNNVTFPIYEILANATGYNSTDSSKSNVSYPSNGKIVFKLTPKKTVGTSDSKYTSTSTSYSTTPNDVLKNLKIDTNEMLQNIDCGYHTIKGPSITIFGKTFYLFEYNAKLNFKFKGIPVSATVDMDSKTIKFLIGFKDYNGTANIGQSYNPNSKTYWSQSYQQVKSMYQDITGKKVDTTKLWNKFSSIRGELKGFECDMIVKAKCYVGGYIELSYETGKAKFSEGGLIFEASIGGDFPARVPGFPLAYVTMGLEASLNGGITVAYENKISIESKLKAELAANIGIGLGWEKTYIEAGVIGTLGANIHAGSGKFANNITTPFSVYLKGEVYADGKALGFKLFNKKWSLGDPVQLYPSNNVSLMSLVDEDIITSKALIANASPISRDYLNDASLFSVNDSDKIYSDTSIYPYNAPVLTTLSDDNMLFVWVDDLGAKNDVNKTSLMYSVFDGESWSEAAEIFETGTYNDYAAIYNNNGTVHLVWLKGKTELPEDAALEELLADTELFYTCYKDGEFSSPAMITDNNYYESQYKVFESNGNIAVAWVENSENDPFLSSGTNSIYLKECVNGVWSEEQLVCSTSDTVNELEIYHCDNKFVCAYTLNNSENELTIYLNTDKTVSGYKLRYYDGKLYYISDNGIVEYNTSTQEVAETGLGGVTNFSIHDGNIYALVGSGLTCELYESINVNGEFSDWTQVTEFDKYIRNYSVTTDMSGEPVYALNLVDIVLDDEVYGLAELVVCKATGISALRTSAVYYDNADLVASGILPLSIDVVNTGTTEINTLNVKVFDAEGAEISSGLINTNIAPGTATTVTYNYFLPSVIEKSEIKVTVTSSTNEKKLEDNSMTTVIGYADVVLSGLSVEKNVSGATVSGVLTNSGFSTAENITVSVYDSSNLENAISTIKVSDINAGSKSNFVFDIPAQYLTLEDKTNMYGLVFKAISDSEESDYANNSDKIVFGELTEYTVTFIDGDYIINVLGIDDFETYTPSKPGYIFDGWYASPDFFEDSKITYISSDVSENIILFAKWINCDINSDASLTVSDAALIIKQLLSNKHEKYPDTDNDNKFTLLDIMRIIRTIVN